MQVSIDHRVESLGQFRLFGSDAAGDGEWRFPGRTVYLSSCQMSQGFMPKANDRVVMWPLVNGPGCNLGKQQPADGAKQRGQLLPVGFRQAEAT